MFQKNKLQKVERCESECYLLKVWGTCTLYTLVHCYGAMKSTFTLDYSGADKFQGPSEETQWSEQVKGMVAGFHVFDNDTALLAWTHSSKVQPISPFTFSCMRQVAASTWTKLILSNIDYIKIIKLCTCDIHARPSDKCNIYKNWLLEGSHRNSTLDLSPLPLLRISKLKKIVFQRKTAMKMGCNPSM